MSPTEDDRILNDLLAGKPFTEVYKSASSTSKFYKNYNIWKKIRKKEYNVSTEKIEAERESLKKLRHQVKLEEQRRDNLSTDIDKIEKQLRSAKKEKEQLQRHLDNYNKAKDDYNKVKEKLFELEKQGITLGLLTRISGIDVESEQAFLERIKTVENHHQLSKEIMALKEKEKQVTQNITQLETTSAGLNEKIENQNLILNNLKVRTRSHENAVKIVTSFFLDGYTTEDFLSLKEAYNLVKVPRDSALSLKNMVEALKKFKGLYGLLDEIRKGKAEQRTLRKNILKLKGELKTFLTITESKIKNIPKTVDTALAKTERQATKEIHGMSKSAIGEIRELKEATLKDISSIQKKASIIEERIDQHMKEAMSAMDEHVDETISRFNEYMAEKKDEIEEWGNMREWIGEYEPKIKQTHLLLGLEDDPDKLAELPQNTIRQIAKAFQNYVNNCLPNTVIEEPSYVKEDRERETHSFQKTFMGHWSFTFHNLFKWCMGELQKNI